MEIKDYLTKECISFSLTATNKADAITELAQILYAGKKIQDVDSFVKAVNKREQEFTTGIGGGIAIPHGKSDVVTSACIAYGKSRKGVAWDSLDNHPVYAIFMLAIPDEEDEVHLDMLSKLARKLMHKEVQESIHQALQIEDFYEAIT